MNSDNNWQEIVDEVFDYNYVKGDPSKFLNTLESVLKEKGYPGPSNPKRPNTFGMNTSGDYEDRVLNNFKAIEALKADKADRPLDRYIMQDILVDKFFNGDQDSAGKFYQEWLKTRGEFLAHKDVDGSDNNMYREIEQLPIWTPNDDVVQYAHWGFMFDYLFGGRHYKPYKEQDRKKKEDEEYYQNRAEGKYRDVCNQCRSDDQMPWISSDADYPKGMIKKSEVCKRCSPEGEKPSKMPDWSYGYYCPICKNPRSMKAVVDNTMSDYNTYIDNIKYWKNLLDYNPNNSEYKKQLDHFENNLYKEGQKCDCSFETLKDVHDRYVQFEDYESLENMKKNKLYNWFFEELNKTQNLNEHIQRIKSIMRL
jgi:hypothetical protein